jgi:hypothetical protein
MLPHRLSQAAAGCIVLSLIPLSGCSIHPLPGDIPRVATVDIVERMRCEAQEGLKEGIKGLKAPLVAQILQGTTIGYDFQFDVTEDNNEGTKEAPGSLTFKRKGRNDDLFTLGLTASSEKRRQNVRRFRIVEDLKVLDKANCSSEAVNWVYPIAGATGMGEVVRTFVKLETMADLQHTRPDTSSSFPSALPQDYANVVFSDVLKFTTTLTASAAPTLKLNAAVGSLRLTDASIVGAAARTDEHDVIVAIARDKTHIVRETINGVERVRVVAAKRSPRTAIAAAKRNELIAREVVRDSRIATALIQKDADARNRVLIELQRLRDLEDDAREAPRLLGERLLEIMRTP